MWIENTQSVSCKFVVYVFIACSSSSLDVFVLVILLCMFVSIKGVSSAQRGVFHEDLLVMYRSTV